MASTKSRCLQQFPHAPNVIGDASGHRGRHAQRFVNAAEVAKTEPAGERSPVVLPLLREGVREPWKPAGTHADRQVLPLDVAGANFLRIGLPENWDHLHVDDLSRGVPALALASGPVDPDGLGEIHAILKRVGNRAHYPLFKRPQEFLDF